MIFLLQQTSGSLAVLLESKPVALKPGLGREEDSSAMGSSSKREKSADGIKFSSGFLGMCPSSRCHSAVLFCFRWKPHRKGHSVPEGTLCSAQGPFYWELQLTASTGLPWLISTVRFLSIGLSICILNKFIHSKGKDGHSRTFLELYST